MNTDVKINTVGEILDGDNAGEWVKILDDFENTGGYLILISNDRGFTSGNDDWVEDYKSLVGYILESDWKLKWD